MHMSARARYVLIETFEGLRELAYRDSGGVLTIGYGHTSRAGAPRVTPDLHMTATEADDVLAQDLWRVEARVSELLRAEASQCEFDALVSLAFNIGCGAFGSSSLLRRFNRRDKKGAANGFLDWRCCRGKIVGGLVRRREAERAWFLGATVNASAAPVETSHRVDHPDSLRQRLANRVANWAS